jgi:hypothetical protein
VEIDRCPGCGAKVRSDAAWCTLCYQDLRPVSELVTTPAPHAADAADTLAAPLVEASLEPGTSSWNDAYDGDIVDAEIVGESVDTGKIYTQRTGSHDAGAGAGAGSDPDGLAALDAELDGTLDANGEPSRLAALTWSCKCGEVVSFAEDGCPVCGSSFLGDLHDGSGGRHRPGGGALNWLPESRQVRLALSAFIAIAIAVFIPLSLSLFG